ncbi:MAG: hypothetical protein LBK00_09840 [Treponema sp.]|jgi:hypothetical protein|nr:hypothetical protein [Treponema sp.]
MLNKNRLINLGTMPFLALFMVLAISCESVSYKWAGIAYHGEETPVLAGTIWEFRASNGGTDRIKFLPGGRANISGINDFTWERTDATVKIVQRKGWSYLEGTYDPETKRISGNGQNSDGRTWAFTMELLPGSPPPSNLVSEAGANGAPNAP